MIIKSKFSPSWWLRNPHLQTIFASKLRAPKHLNLRAEKLELPDGDFVNLLWSARRATDGPNVPTVCLFHGLAGSVKSAYINGIISALTADGFQVVLMHFRGCGGEPNRLSKTYHSGHTEDIKYLIGKVRNRFPDSKLHAVGYSLGANALLKYLGEEKENCPLTSAVAVCPPLVLHEGANRMNLGISRLYQAYLLKTMHRSHEEKRRIYPMLNLPPVTADMNSFWTFDDGITAPLNGFSGVKDYYEQSSARQYLKDIRIKTRIMFSADDPFFTKKVIPSEAELSEHVIFELSDYGGHVGYVSGHNPMSPRYWLDERIKEILSTS